MLATTSELLLWIIFAALLLILALAAVPIKFYTQVHAKPQIRLRVQVGLLAGLVPLLTLFDTKRPQSKKGSRSKRRRTATSEKAMGSRFRRRMAQNVVRLIGDLLRQFRFEKLVVRGRFGLGDPADTGEVFGALCPFIYGARPKPHINLAVVPDFENACLDGNMKAKGSVVPLRLIPPFVRFSWRSFGPYGAG